MLFGMPLFGQMAHSHVQSFTSAREIGSRTNLGWLSSGFYVSPESHFAWQVRELRSRMLRGPPPEKAEIDLLGEAMQVATVHSRPRPSSNGVGAHAHVYAADARGDRVDVDLGGRARRLRGLRAGQSVHHSVSGTQPPPRGTGSRGRAHHPARRRSRPTSPRSSTRMTRSNPVRGAISARSRRDLAPHGAVDRTRLPINRTRGPCSL